MPDPTASDTAGVPPIELAGTSWSVTHHASDLAGGSITNIWPGTEVTLEFGPEGQISGNAGCNDYTATYRTQGGYIAEPDPLSDEQSGQAITVTDVAATERACDDTDTMEQEAEYLQLLSEVELWSIGAGFESDESLLLRSAEGGLLIEAVPAG